MMAPPRYDLKKTYQAVNPSLFGGGGVTFRLPTDYALPGPTGELPPWAVAGGKKAKASRPNVDIPEFIQGTLGEGPLTRRIREYSTFQNTLQGRRPFGGGNVAFHLWKKSGGLENATMNQNGEVTLPTGGFVSNRPQISKPFSRLHNLMV